MGQPKEGFVFFVLFVVALGSATNAQEPPVVTASVSNLTRVESWSFFDPYPAVEPGQLVGHPDYTFIGDRAELGVRVDGRRFDLSGAFNYVRLENVPTGAIGPGGLGVGAFYFAATGLSYSYQLYLSELTLRVSAVDDRSSVALGRMKFASGAEFTSGNPSLDHLKRERLHSRLVGNFEWSYYQRRFDGARLDIARPEWHVTAAALLPTQGGFEESTNLSMPNVQVATASYTRKGGAHRQPLHLRAERFGGQEEGVAATSESQVFGTVYRDRREMAAVVDNTRSLDRPVDVTIAALGGSHARITPTRRGELDTVFWGAVETGDWYGQSHRAASVAAEVGHRWTGAAGRPWLRAGYLWSSGDGDPADDRHGTFFQMLPSSRQYSLSATYAQVNLTDAFVQAAFEPRGVKTRIEVHAVGLASGQDLWYQGSGATASTGRYFGFSGRAAGGHSRLGTVLEGAVDVPLKTYWSVNAYVGTMWGGGVVKHNFSGTRLTFWYLENVFRF
ncbi:MAG: alginate export family protein [Acidobacteriota bacterium]|nr:alginate export family protein [Acidobacteriota bacterium]